MKDKISTLIHMPGHKNSKGEKAEWVIKSHTNGKILSSHKSKEEANKHLQEMHIFGGMNEVRFSGITNLKMLFNKVANYNDNFTVLKQFKKKLDTIYSELVHTLNEKNYEEHEEDVILDRFGVLSILLEYGPGIENENPDLLNDLRAFILENRDDSENHDGRDTYESEGWNYFLNVFDETVGKI